MSNIPESADEVLTLLRTFMEHEKDVYGLLTLGIFGSFARNEADSDSDVDIVFETSKQNLFLTAKMKAELEDLLARRVDVVRLRKHMNSRLRQRIMQDVRYV